MVAGGTGYGGDVSMKKERIPIEECCEEMLLTEDLYNESGLLLLTKGTKLTNEKINMLIRRGVEYVPAEQ